MSYLYTLNMQKFSYAIVRVETNSLHVALRQHAETLLTCTFSFIAANAVLSDDHLTGWRRDGQLVMTSRQAGAGLVE